MVDYYSTTQALIKGRKVYLRFSRHQELAESKMKTNKILLASLQMDIQPLTVPITVDVIWQIFSPYGIVEKIVMLNKSAGLQALVQFAAEPFATLALQSLNGQAVYVGTDPIVTLTLDIQYSNLQSLIVRQNTFDSRDYTPYSYMFQQPHALPPENPPTDLPS